MKIAAPAKLAAVWPQHRGVALGVGGVLVMMSVITGANVFSGMPEARPPAESLFQYPDAGQWQQEPSDRAVAGSFSDRPLFKPSRRATATVEAREVPVAPAVVMTRTLDGWALLGIFDSGEMKGAIVRQRDGSRYRPVLGEQIDNWRLVSVSARSAQFESVTDGSVAEVLWVWRGSRNCCAQSLPMTAVQRSRPVARVNSHRKTHRTTQNLSS